MKTRTALLLPIFGILALGASAAARPTEQGDAASSAPAAAASAKVAQEVTDALAASPSAAVIVSLRAAGGTYGGGRPNLTVRAASVASATDAVARAVAAPDFKIVRRYGVVPAIAGQATAAGVAALAAQPQVLRISLNGTVHADLAQAVPLINADDVHLLGTTGTGVNVAVLDTGIDTDHPMLSDDIVHEECFLASATCPGGSGTTGTSAEDGDGHGTHVSGIITSNGPPIGIAPDANILAFKVLDDSGGGSFSDILAAYDHIELSHSEVDIINMSLSDSGAHPPGTCDGIIPALTSSIADTRAMGITTFAASGNEAFKTAMGYPACTTDIVSVGATYDASLGFVGYPTCSDATSAADQVTCFSNSDVSLDLLAPGSLIESTFVGGGTLIEAGTSMASPAAAAVAALLLDSEPTLMPAAVEARLTETGVPVTDAANGVTACRVNAIEAVLNDGGPICSTTGPGGGPPNDNFVNAYTVIEPLPYMNTQTTAGATLEPPDENTACEGFVTMSPTVWYAYTPTSSQTITVDTFGSSFDTTLAVYTGSSLATLMMVGCNDDTGGLQSEVSFPATGGETYQIQAGGYFGSTGSLTLTVSGTGGGGPCGNLGFEAGVADTDVIPCWTVFNEAGSSGTWCNQTGAFAPGGPCAGSGAAVAPPPELLQAAMTGQGGAGAHVLYRCGTLSAGAISFELYLNNLEVSFFDPPSLSYTVVPNQQFRANLVTQAGMAANPLTLAGGDILMNLYATPPGHPASMGYFLVAADASAFIGSAVCLRFAQVDNQFFFHAGVDAVSISFAGGGGGGDNDGPGGSFGGTVPPAPPWILDGVAPEGLSIGADGVDPNDDNDQCGDGSEPGLTPARNPLNPWDFASMWVPSLPAAGARNTSVTIADVIAVLPWVGTVNNGGPNGSSPPRDYDDDANGNGVEDGAEYDRTPTGTIGLSGAPSGAVTIQDAIVVLAQVGDVC